MAGIVTYSKRLGSKKEWLFLGRNFQSNSQIILTRTDNRKNTSKILRKIDSNVEQYSENFTLKTLVLPENHDKRNQWSLRKKLALAFGFCLIIAECKRQNKTEVKFFNCVRYGSSKELRKFLKDGSVDANLKHHLGWTALHLAAVNGNSEILKILIEAGCDVNAGDEYINNYRTAHEKGLNTFEVLLQRETEFSDVLRAQENYLGFTPLHYAVLAHSLDCVLSLIAAGANPLIEASGHKAIDLAHDHKEIEHVLKEYIVKFEENEKERQAEERRKFPLEQRLKQYIVGQEGAISIVASAIRRKENGWADDEHPLVFLFLGSSGIGKTELAKQVARYMHKDNPASFIRLDMSEYQEKHEVAKLIGAPPGYVGHDAGGQLTKNLRNCPNAVVLLDEVDKAHPDVLTVLLQLFDEGRLTDGKGKTVECKNAIFVMTSNLASEEIAEHAIQLRSDVKRLAAKKEEEFSEEVTISRSFKDKVVRPILKRHFGRDEFLGRINEIVYFLPFSNSELNKLVSKELNYWATKAKEKHNVILYWDTGVETVLAGGYNMHYGARSIKYEVERRVVSKLAAAQEAGVLKPGCSVHLVVHWPDQNEAQSEPSIKLRLQPKGMKDFVDIEGASPLKKLTNAITENIWS
ncbi:mitochondrial disaggregase [Halyomorpha halys]|uniref:mitochondrial disaggregase n=1 Tax=Halyomorpha halys TaxID=286706 RepID=UPI0006D4FBCA|nr:caseinolytic peptidase B protein homolog [Halyomorpha halys]